MGFLTEYNLFTHFSNTHFICSNIAKIISFYWIQFLEFSWILSLDSLKLNYFLLITSGRDFDGQNEVSFWFCIHFWGIRSARYYFVNDFSFNNKKYLRIDGNLNMFSWFVIVQIDYMELVSIRQQNDCIEYYK